MERIPYSDKEYDFSHLYGEQEWSERTLSYKFNIVGKQAKEYFHIIETQLLHWLVAPSTKMELKDDMLPGFYFLAESVAEASNDYKFVMGTLTITFTAYSHKIATLKEGHDIWDEFFFDLDYAQDTSFNVTGSQDITLQNPGNKKARPTIVTDRAIEIVKDDVTYSIPSGTTKSLDFTLSPGENRVRIIGTATVSFEFYKEMI
ncbi:phage tail protein [Alkalihalobacillus sp. FSL R5-0424]